MALPDTSVLPRDLVESQIAMVELLMAMYPAPPGSEAEIATAVESSLGKAREWCEESSSAGQDTDRDCLPHSLDLTITVPIEKESSDVSESIQMNVSVPLRSPEADPAEPPPITYTLRQPTWLSRTEVSELLAAMPMGDVFTALEYVKDNADKYLPKDKQCSEAPPTSTETDTGPLLRVWFYFPSLSTREKRKDLVTYASSYHLTGFVLAGKPGVLCLEGTSQSVDAYMNAIKNESWGDIPSHQKKVSERFREDCGAAGRKFEGMREITDDLGERRGARKNRGDMAALEAYLTEQGVGASFSKVIMGA